jgi:serine/threonine protein kinase
MVLSYIQLFGCRNDEKTVGRTDDNINFKITNKTIYISPSISFPVFTFELFCYDRSGEYPESIHRNYFVGRDLGSGACGVVRLVQHRKTCDIFAMKAIQRKSAVASVHNHRRGTNDDVNIQREIQIMNTIDHVSN